LVKNKWRTFLCIEPWFGVADEQNVTQNLEDKKGLITLQKDEVFLAFIVLRFN